MNFDISFGTVICQLWYDRSCNNQLVTTELVLQCRKSQLLTELREWEP